LAESCEQSVPTIRLVRAIGDLVEGLGKESPRAGIYHFLELSVRR
jgi:hypothetical protein